MFGIEDTIDRPGDDVMSGEILRGRAAERGKLTARHEQLA
jgi:hypothetical protein